MNESSSSSMINRIFSQLGVPIVKDRTSCSLAACRTTVCQQALGRSLNLTSTRQVSQTRQTRSERKRRFCSGSTATWEGEACAVCSDEASGCHYGAVTCDSCKMFFERSVRDRHIYDCHFNRACDLRLQRRNHCQGCRWDKCLEAGMIVSVVCKTRVLGYEMEAELHQQHRHRQWTGLVAEDVLRMADQSSNLAATPRPSLPSPTDTENSQYDEFWDDETGGLSALTDSQPRLQPMPLEAELMRDALIPLESPESLAARLTDLERSCLATLFWWNKRRLEHRSDNFNGNFGAAANNWTLILLATAARQFLANCQDASVESGESLAIALTDRLKWLLRGREFEFEPLLDQFEILAKQIGSMCSQLMSSALQTKRDVIRDIILLMGDQTEDELRVSLQQVDSSRQQQQHQVLASLSSGAERLTSARPEQRALLLAALVADIKEGAAAAPSAKTAAGKATASTTVEASTATTCLMPGREDESGDDVIRVPVLFGL